MPRAISSVYTHGYDTLSRRVSLQRPNGVTTSYVWDQADRLSRMTHTNAAGVALEDFQYGYNLDDEVTSITSLASASKLPTAKTAAAADAANRISQFGNASYSFDTVGQTIAKTDGNGKTQYNWDARGRLTNVTLPNGEQVGYGYDALGRRASRTAGGVTTSFLYDGGDVVVDMAGSALTEYLHGAGVDEHLRQGAAGSGLYFLQDHLGSTAALTNASGGVVERQSYEPFGAGGASSLTRYEYTGREKDALTGLLHYRNREYDAEQGRFLTEDPAGLSGGLNLYAYAANSPLNFNDPFGLSVETFLEGVFAGLGVGVIVGGILGGIVTVVQGTPLAPIVDLVLAGLAVYGLYSLAEEVKEISRMYGSCPDEAHRGIGYLLGSFFGGAAGARAAGSAAAKWMRARRIQKIIDDIEKAGLDVKVNPKNPATLQEGNVTVDLGNNTRLNLRVETHSLTPNGPPVRHANVEVIQTVRGKNIPIQNIHIQ